MALVLGIIGGIGSGKSLVSSILAEHGGRLIEGDQLGHEALRQPELRDQVVAKWGRDLLGDDGAISRKKLGNIVFADAYQRRELEKIVFPFIEAGIERRIAAARQDSDVRFIVLDAAVMLEAGWDRFCDRIIFVDVPKELRIKRLATQRGWTETELEARECAQQPLAEKRSRADVILDNSGAPERTRTQIESRLAEWLTSD